MKVRLIILLCAVMLGLAGCGVSVFHLTTDQFTAHSRAPNDKLGIYALVQGDKIRKDRTILTLQVSSVKRTYSSDGHSAVKIGSEISVVYPGTVKDYPVGFDSPTGYLPAWNGLEIATIIVSKDGGKSWVDNFEAYEYQKYGAYFNWKGHDFGSSAFQ